MCANKAVWGDRINNTDENKVILFEEVAVEQRSRYPSSQSFKAALIEQLLKS